MGFVAGFLDELLKLGAVDRAAAQGTGLQAAKPMKPIGPPKELPGVKPIKPTQPIAAAQFQIPPGMKPLRAPKLTSKLPRLPAVAPKVPRPWKRTSG